MTISESTASVKHTEHPTCKDQGTCTSTAMLMHLFLNSFPKKCMDHDSKNSGFRFDIVNPLWLWHRHTWSAVQWI